MRIDSDSLATQAPGDPFKEMERNHWIVGYRTKIYRGGGCTRSLKEQVKKYAKKNGLVPANQNFFDRITKGDMYFYGNLMLGDLRFFRSDAYKAFMEHILLQEGIWTVRWDDQHLYALAVALLSDEHRIGATSFRITHKGDKGKPLKTEKSRRELEFKLSGGVKPK